MNKLKFCLFISGVLLFILLTLAGMYSLIKVSLTSRGNFVIRAENGQVIHAKEIVRTSSSTTEYKSVDDREGIVVGNHTIEEVK